MKSERRSYFGSTQKAGGGKKRFMWGDFYAYLNSLGQQWFTVASTSVPFVINESLRSSDRYRAIANRVATPDNRRLALFLLVLASVFLAGFMAWRDEHSALAGVQEKLDIATKKRVSGALECAHSYLPSEATSNKSMYFMHLGDPNTEALGFAERMPPVSGKKWEWPNIDRAYRCDFTNAGSEPISNVTISFDLTFFETESVRASNQPRAMERVAQRRRVIRIPNVLQGNKFSFYTYNTSNCYVTLDVNKDASFENIAGERDSIVLTLGNNADMSMPPLKIDTKKLASKPKCNS